MMSANHSEELTLIEMTRRRVKPGTGSSLQMLQERTAMNRWPDLRDSLRGVQWAVVGGVATRAYMAERMTKDLDILVRMTDGEEVISRLKQGGHQVVSPLALPGYLLRSPDGVEVDVLFGQYDWLNEAFGQLKTDSAGYPVLALSYLVLMKFEAGRTQDWADVSRMLGFASDNDLDEVRKVVSRYSPEDVEDLESLIFIGKKERETPASIE